MEVVELFGIKGNNYYIENRAFNQCYVFDSFGGLVNTQGFMMECPSIQKVNILSAISEGSGYYEVYFNGKTKYFSGNIIQDVSMKLRTKNGYLGNLFHFKSEEEDGCIINHLILVYPLGVMTNNDIDMLLKGKEISDWVTFQGSMM